MSDGEDGPGRSDPSVDLGAAEVSQIADPLIRWEKSFPFHRVRFSRMRAKIRSLPGDTFLIGELKPLLTTEAWVGQLGPGGNTYKLI